MMAAANGSDGSVKRLLKAGAPCSTTATSNGWNAFMFAARRGHIATSNLLLEAGGAQVSLYTCAHDGKSAIELAELNSDKVKGVRMTRFLKEAMEADPKVDDPKVDDSKAAAGGDAGGASKSSKRESSKRESSKRGRAHAAGGRGGSSGSPHEDVEGRAQERSHVGAGNVEAADAGGVAEESSASQSPPLPSRRGKASENKASMHPSTVEAKRKRAERLTRGAPRASASASASAAPKAAGQGHTGQGNVQGDPPPPPRPSQTVLAAAVKAEVEKEAAAMVAAARSSQQTQQSPAPEPHGHQSCSSCITHLGSTGSPAGSAGSLDNPKDNVTSTSPAAGLAATSRWRSLQQLMHSAGAHTPAAPAPPASPAATGQAAASRWKSLQQLSVASALAAAFTAPFTALGSASDSFLKGRDGGSFKKPTGSFKKASGQEAGSSLQVDSFRGASQQDRPHRKVSGFASILREADSGLHRLSLSSFVKKKTPSPGADRKATGFASVLREADQAGLQTVHLAHEQWVGSASDAASHLDC